MERRAFLKLLCIGAGVVAAGAPAEAFTSFMPLTQPGPDPDLAPQPGVATSKDMERAQVEKAWNGHWRRVNRRHWRRVRRRYYYCSVRDVPAAFLRATCPLKHRRT